MASIIPFSGVHFNEDTFPRITDQVCPFMDTEVPDDGLRKKLRDRSSNYIHVAYPLGESNVRSKNSANKFYAWLLRDILVLDNAPSFYIHSIEFTVDGAEYQRSSIIGLVNLENVGDSILPLEKGVVAHTDEQLHLLRENQAGLSMVNGLFADTDEKLSSIMPGIFEKAQYLFETTGFDRNIHKIYRVGDEDVIRRITAYFQNRKIFIGEDVHAFEAAVRYRNEKKEELGSRFTGKEPFNYAMVDLFSAIEEPALFLPFHRMIQNLNMGPAEFMKQLDSNYKVAAIPFADPKMELMARKKMRSMLAEAKNSGGRAFGLYLKQFADRYFIINQKQVTAGDEDADVLEKTVLVPVIGFKPDELSADIRYESSDHSALDHVKSGEYSGVFILSTLDIASILKEAEKKPLAYKSGYLYPRNLNGLMAYSYRYSKIG